MRQLLLQELPLVLEHVLSALQHTDSGTSDPTAAAAAAAEPSPATGEAAAVVAAVMAPLAPVLTSRAELLKACLTTMLQAQFKENWARSQSLIDEILKPSAAAAAAGGGSAGAAAGTRRQGKLDEQLRKRRQWRSQPVEAVLHAAAEVAAGRRLTLVDGVVPEYWHPMLTDLARCLRQGQAEEAEVSTGIQRLDEVLQQLRQQLHMYEQQRQAAATHAAAEAAATAAAEHPAVAGAGAARVPEAPGDALFHPDSPLIGSGQPAAAVQPHGGSSCLPGSQAAERHDLQVAVFAAQHAGMAAQHAQLAAEQAKLAAQQAAKMVQLEQQLSDEQARRMLLEQQLADEQARRTLLEQQLAGHPTAA